MRDKDWNGFTPDEDSRAPREDVTSVVSREPHERLVKIAAEGQELAYQLGELLGVSRRELAERVREAMRT